MREAKRKTFYESVGKFVETVKKIYQFSINLLIFSSILQRSARFSIYFDRERERKKESRVNKTYCYSNLKRILDNFFSFFLAPINNVQFQSGILIPTVRTAVNSAARVGTSEVLAVGLSSKAPNPSPLASGNIRPGYLGRCRR